MQQLIRFDNNLRRSLIIFFKKILSISIQNNLHKSYNQSVPIIRNNNTFILHIIVCIGNPRTYIHIFTYIHKKNGKVQQVCVTKY